MMTDSFECLTPTPNSADLCFLAFLHKSDINLAPQSMPLEMLNQRTRLSLINLNIARPLARTLGPDHLLLVVQLRMCPDEDIVQHPTPRIEERGVEGRYFLGINIIRYEALKELGRIRA